MQPNIVTCFSQFMSTKIPLSFKLITQTQTTLFTHSSTMNSATVLHHNRRLLNHLSQLSTAENSHLLHWHYTEFDDHNFQIHGQTLFYLFILFAVILLVTLLLLYARWYFRFRHLHTAANAHYAHQYNSHAPPGEARACKGLDPAAIKAMPIILHQETPVEREDEMECCICLGVFEDGDKCKVLPECRHRFHSDCVDRWLLAQSSCPLCRKSLRVDPPSESALADAV